MKRPVPRHIVAGHWIGKTTAGLFCGLALALALSGLLVQAARTTRGDAGLAEVAMLAVAPIWTAVFALAFAFRQGWRAWAWLGASSVLAWALLWACG
jgi:hypothetical protein